MIDVIPTYLRLIGLMKSANHVVHLITFVIRLTALKKYMQINVCCRVKFYSDNK